MEILFESDKLLKACNSRTKLRRQFGAPMAAKVELRLVQLEAAPTLKHMEGVPAARCHELRENLSGKFAVKLVEPNRLVFEPAHNPIPRLEAGNIDTGRITRIKILAIMDYHGK